MKTRTGCLRSEQVLLDALHELDIQRCALHVELSMARGERSHAVQWTQEMRQRINERSAQQVARMEKRIGL